SGAPRAAAAVVGWPHTRSLRVGNAPASASAAAGAVRAAAGTKDAALGHRRRHECLWGRAEDSVEGHLLRESAVDIVGAAGDVLSLVAGEEDSHRGDLLGTPKTAPWDLAVGILERLRVFQHRLVDRS